MQARTTESLHTPHSSCRLRVLKKWAVNRLHVIRHVTKVNMAAEDLVDFSEVRAAKEHTLAVNRDYISQPRLSNLNLTTCFVNYNLPRFFSLQNCFRSEWTTGNIR